MSDFSDMLSRKAKNAKQFNTQQHLQFDVKIEHGADIQFSGDNKIIWINIDGLCVLRIFNPDNKNVEIFK